MGPGSKEAALMNSPPSQSVAPMLRRTTHMSSPLLWLFVCGVFAYVSFTRSLFGIARPSSNSVGATPAADMAGLEDRPRTQQGLFLSSGDATSKQYRVSYGAGVGAIVRGWPAKGGFYELYPCLTVELDFLGLDRFQEVERPVSTGDSKEDEEAHCRRMRQLGAVWWQSEEDQALWDLEHQNAHSKTTDRTIHFGWPAKGGVWVLNIPSNKASELGTARINIAVNMEERCKVLETLGAVYYENPEDCPDLDLSG